MNAGGYSPSPATVEYAPRTKKDHHKIVLGEVMSPREAVLRAQEVNARAGNENQGFLSFSHGFAPRVTPVTRFPPEFDVWNKLVEKLPFLVSSRKLRSYCDSHDTLPVLDATRLPALFALRAANVMGFTAHAYWNLGEVPEGKKLPDGLEVPWQTVSKFHLGRQGTHFLGFFEQITANFRFEEGRVPPPPPGAEACPWLTDELVKYGSVEYNPAQANVGNYYPSLLLSGMQEEKNFFGVVTEMQLAGAPAVQLVVDAQEAASANDVNKLKQQFENLLNLLRVLTFDVLSKIQQQRKAPHYIDAAVWCKIVAPIAVPITSTSLGPSGTASPLIHLLDVFFGRTKHEGFIGKEIKGLFKSFPTNWTNFLIAVRNGPNIPSFVYDSGDRELQGLFGACLQQYAGENGFLGRHKLKMLGYIEVAMKLGRDATIGGVAGLLKDRAWDKIADHLKIGQDERFAIPIKAGGLYNVGKIIQIPDAELRGRGQSTTAYHIRIDVKYAGIRVVPGSHVGILYESSVEEVHKTLLSFADGDANKAMTLGEEYMVDLNLSWIKALQQRQEYHETTGCDYPNLPTQLKLSTFLKYGELRPASHKMLQLAYRASHSNEILSILNADLVAALTFSDVVTILRRDKVDLLRASDSPNKINLTAIEENLKRLKKDGGRRGGAINVARGTIFQGAGLTPQQEGRLTIVSTSIKAARDKVLRVVPQIPKLCELVEPSRFRHYSVACSSLVHPNEIHLYVEHLMYQTKSAVVRTSPLLADTQELVQQRGAASDYIVSKSLPRHYIAIDIMECLANLKRDDDDYERKVEELKFNLSDERKQLLKYHAHLDDDEINAIVERASGYSGGQAMFKNLLHAITDEISDTADPRDLSVVLKSYESPRFRLPSSMMSNPQPVIMIAAGTGLAPFRAFWQHLAMAPRPANGNKHLLIVGQRTRKNMAFENEILVMVNANILDVEIIFSADECRPNFSESEIIYEDAPGCKGYIDEIIRDKAIEERLAQMINTGAYMYLCGTGAMARTALDALDSSLCDRFGEIHGKELLEKMVAENRMVLDIFTSLKQPKMREAINLSELCQCNDFVGVRKGKGKEKRLLLVINATVYDMNRLFSLHPGGDSMLKLYCGMDATKAWNGVKHSETPEVAAMLEMFDTKQHLRNAEVNLVDSENDWYRHGWKAMTSTLVEIQNAMSLAFAKNWDSGTYSLAEENLGEHFTVWERKAMWRPRRSLLKAEFFISTHNRLWSLFLPSLLGDDFDELLSGMSDRTDWYDLRMVELQEYEEHRICDALVPLLKQELDKASAAMENIAMPVELQALMEEVRNADDALLEGIKSHLIAGLVVFENHKSPLLPAFHANFDSCIVGILNELEVFTSKLASLAITYFGDERVKGVADMPNLKRGGIASVGSADLDHVVRHLMDKDEKRNLGHVNVGHDSTPKCPMHLGP